MSRRIFRALYREHYGFIWASVRRLGVPAALIDDAAQDTFIVAYRKRAELEGPGVRPWLYGIARRVASNYRRTARRSARKRKAIANTAVPSSVLSAEPQIELHDLDRFLHALPARDRELFVLSEVEGFTGPELANALGCNMSTAYGRVRTLRQRLARHTDDAVIEQSRERRPRATAQGWALLVPALRASEPGWFGLGTMGTNLLAASLGAAASAAVVVGVIVPATPGPSASATERPTTRASHSNASAATTRAHASDPTTTPKPQAEPPPPLRATAASAPPVAPARGATPSARPKPSAPVDELARENALLAEAAQALSRGDPQRALDAMQEHARQFPSSAMGDLRAKVRVQALCALGKPEQARGEARSYIRTHPGTPLPQKFLDACPAQSRPAGQDQG